MKKFIPFIAIVLLCVSCKEEISVYNSTSIYIENKTNDLIHVKLYSNRVPTHVDESLHYPPSDYYLSSSGTPLKAEFDLAPSNNDDGYFGHYLYGYDRLDVTTAYMASIAFNRIEISFPGNDKAKIVFTPKEVTGYSDNIFAEDAIWDYEVVEGEVGIWINKKDIFREHRYTFVISEDKITSE